MREIAVGGVGGRVEVVVLIGRLEVIEEVDDIEEVVGLTCCCCC